MRKLSQNLGLGLLSSLFLVIPACGDDSPGETETSTTAGSGHSTATHGTTSVGATSVGTTSVGTTSVGATSVGATTAGTTSAGTSATTTTAGTTGGTGTTTTTGTDTTGGAADQKPVHDLIGELCKWNGRCCDAGEFSYIFGSWTKNVKECTDRMIAFYNSNDTDPKDAARVIKGGGPSGILSRIAFQVNSTRSMPVKAELDKCAAYIKTLDCNEIDDGKCETPSVKTTEGPCQLNKMFTGKLGKDAACNKSLADSYLTDIECKEGYSCALDGNSAGNGDNAICVARGTLGKSCSPTENPNDVKGTCEYGLYCDKDDATCKKRPTVGEACSYSDYDSPTDAKLDVPCERPYTCDPVQKKCVDTCSKGAECAFDTDPDPAVEVYESFDDMCPSGHSCLPYVHKGAIVPEHGYCGAVVTAGDACNSQKDCGAGTHCNETTNLCQANLAIDGVDCLFDYQCGPKAYCDNGTTDAAGAGGANFKCKGLISAPAGAPTDGPNCDEDGHRSCFQGAAGCFTVEEDNGSAVKVCLAKGDRIPTGQACQAADAAGNLERDFGFIENNNWERVTESIDDYGVWANMCESGVCSSEGGTDTRNTVCMPGIPAGGACDYVYRKINTGDGTPTNANGEGDDNIAKGDCQPGLDCINGVCQAWLKPGEECDFDYNKSAADGGTTVYPNDDANDFAGTATHTKRLCHPDASCELVGAKHVCTTVKTTTEVIACDGDGIEAAG